MYGEVGCHGQLVVLPVAQEQKLEFAWFQLMKKMAEQPVVVIVLKRLNKVVELVPQVFHNKQILFHSSLNLK